MEVLEDILLLVVILLFSLGLPLLIWYFIIRWIVKGRRAARAVLSLSETLTEEQAEEFDRLLLPKARNVFQQLELLEEYVGKINDADKTWTAASDDDVASPVQVSAEGSDSLDSVVSPRNSEIAEEASILQQLERLASLRQQDLITEAEYIEMKSRLIDGRATD